jgi:hypothetical protein
MIICASKTNMSGDIYVKLTESTDRKSTCLTVPDRRKTEYPEKTSDMSQVTDKLYQIWVTCIVSYKKQELLTRTSQSTSIYSGVCVARSFVFCLVFCKSLFVLFLWAIVLSLSFFDCTKNPPGMSSLKSVSPVLSHHIYSLKSVSPILTHHIYSLKSVSPALSDHICSLKSVSSVLSHHIINVPSFISSHLQLEVSVSSFKSSHLQLEVSVSSFIWSH